MSVTEIKETATRNVKLHTRGASVVSLLKTARTQAIQGFASERAGDLKTALQALWTAAQLTNSLMSSPEGKAELEKKGEVWREFVEFQQVSVGHPAISARTDHDLTAIR
jgi:ubiquitin carboxyl-terminal hydrolase 8